MEIFRGKQYVIITMPENLSPELIDVAIAECEDKCRANPGDSVHVLDVRRMTQLHRAGLQFIGRLVAKMEEHTCRLSIAGCSEAVENALRHQHVDEKVALYRTFFDFERESGLRFGHEPQPSPVDRAPPAGGASRISTVLILDPSDTARANQKNRLGKYRVRNIIEARDPVEAGRRLKESSVPIDLVFLDLASAGQAGIAFLRAMRSWPCLRNATAVATIAENLSRRLIDDAMQAGATGTIRRSFDEGELDRLFE